VGGDLLHSSPGRARIGAMARDFLFAVMLGGAALIGSLPLTPNVKGWKSILFALGGVASIFLIWTLASQHLPR